MKIIQLLCLVCASIFTLLFLTTLINPIDHEHEFRTIITYERGAAVLTPSCPDYTAEDLDKNAEQWRKLGYTTITYYDDAHMEDRHYVATYWGARNLGYETSIVEEFDAVYDDYASLDPDLNYCEEELDKFMRKELAPSGALIFAIAFVILRRKQKV